MPGQSGTASSSQLEGLVQAGLRVEARRPAQSSPILSRRKAMSTTHESRLNRAERLQLAAAVLRGILSGATRAVFSWLLEEHIHH
jgi:hypothetical protein